MNNVNKQFDEIFAKELIPADIYEAYKPINNVNEFLDGMRDARHGVNHRAGMGEEYDRGYSAQYTAEQNRSAL
jgi:hypothetical protein